VNIPASSIHRTRLDELLRVLTADDFHCGFALSPYETLAIIAGRFDQSVLGSAWPAQRTAFLQVLAQQQASDGSWGGDRHGDFTPDRIITTLAALAAYDRHGLLEDEQRDRAVHYLRQHIPFALTTPDAKKPIAFDALLVELLDDIGRRGCEILPASHLESLVQLRDAKLHKKKELLTRGRGTIHSILDTMSTADLDWQKIAEFQERDGSMGIYPSSTAALLSNSTRDSPAFERGAAYLRSAMRPDGGFPPFHPSAEFERWWSLLALAQSPLEGWVHLPPWLTGDLPKQGISVAQSFSLPDVDTASMKAATLITLGHPVDLSYLSSFYRDGVFECYEHEHRVSPSANIHALMAIVAAMSARAELVQAAHHRMVATSLGYLLETLGAQDHFEDKWHLSDLYTTAHAVELFADMLTLPSFPGGSTFADHVRAKLGDLASYLLEHHNADGGFGFRRTSTIEETGYAVHALCILACRTAFVVPASLLSRAGEYLQTHDVDDDPPLWLGKTLYRSPIITMSEKISAQAWLSHIDPRAAS
jgi:hypothetical protein